MYCQSYRRAHRNLRGGTPLKSVLVASVLGAMVLACESRLGVAATFEPIRSSEVMGILIDGEIRDGDDARLQASIANARRRFPDHRLRAIGLSSPGGQVAAARAMAGQIRELGLVTVVPESRTCASACVLLFAAGSIKIASTGSRIGVHGVSIAGHQNVTALAITTDMAKLYADFGVPASVIGRMVVTEPHEMQWLSGNDVMMFPRGVVQRASVANFPVMMAGYDDLLRGPIPVSAFPYLPDWLTRPAASQPHQQTGRALPQLSPPSVFQLPPPIRSRELLLQAQSYAAGYIEGAANPRATCRGAVDWRRGCFGGQSAAAKPYNSGGISPLPVSTHARNWLEAYDYSYRTKSGSDCGNGTEPSNDGCRVGASAWPRSNAVR
jgi:hypothetical protein